ncbi:sigma-54 dependent transcriptional regulator [Desulforhopalus sp. IMCC35007]|uniref:sigma-54-dependent transcriptional regulator n=1 Tax=Desulforhopalus sp. IMCC35007 TaxID=2569543 RepID=UPI0010ADDB10|nr:sigma-54 dependent transcriptional regulator [Desulforhopalus sp. IMCC35007]TKB09014.1 sigma-54-dependent Fis family transcriptional regulator [Desulforhopalus sp. IMCC35007]
MALVLIVDDEQGMRDFLKILLEKEGHKVITANKGTKALEILETKDIELVISDIRMPEMSGIELLEIIKEKSPEMPIIMITAFASPDDAVIAMKNGAFDYISKPFNVEEIISVIRSATARNNSKIATPQLSESFPEIIGQSREMLKIFDMIRRVAPTPANVLIYGESGTGKELVAQAIHNHSKVASENFVPITCSAIPEDLMESELFGHVKGSFTGAIGDKPGLFNEADKGTAFLDEIGELTPIIQTKLLRVLQEREIKAVGGTKSKPIRVRIIAATNKVLEEEIRAGRFREDLFYRLAVVPIRVPPLRERKGDVPLLVDFFLKKYSQLLGKEVQEISSYAMQVLMNYDFPGNVRELENIIERGVALESSNIILPESLTLGNASRTEDMTIEIQQNNPLLLAASSEEELYDLGLDKVIENLEKRLISHALEKTNNSKMKAADLLQVSFRSLRYKVKKYGLD